MTGADPSDPSSPATADSSEAATRSDVYASEATGARYRGTEYVPVDYETLKTVPEAEGYPDRGTGGAYRRLDLPAVPKPRHVVGPSAIMLGASLGSGETLFWPSLVARNGWTVYWAFWVGVLTQFFVNTELQRWTLTTGESVFRAFGRVHRGWPWFFLLCGFVSPGWPGWAASAAQVGATGSGSTRCRSSLSLSRAGSCSRSR